VDTDQYDDSVVDPNQYDDSVVDPDQYEASTFSPENIIFPDNVQPPRDEYQEYTDVSEPNGGNPYDVTYDDYNTVIENIAPGIDAPNSGYGGNGEVTQDTVEQANQFSPALAPIDPVQMFKAPVDPIQAPVDPIFAPVDPIFAPVDPIFAPVDPITPGLSTPADSLATPRTPDLLGPAIQADTFYGAPPQEDSETDSLANGVSALSSPSQVLVDEMLPPGAKAPMSFYGAPVEEAEAAAANVETAIEELLEVPAEEPQTFYGAPRQGRLLALQRNNQPRRQQQSQRRRPQGLQQRGFQPRPHRGPRRNLGRRG